MVVDTHRFTGFRPEAIDFLADLAQNNERSWFQPRKADYERLLKVPLEELSVALEEQFRSRSRSSSASGASRSTPIRPRRRSASTATCASPRTSGPTTTRCVLAERRT